MKNVFVMAAALVVAMVVTPAFAGWNSSAAPLPGGTAYPKVFYKSPKTPMKVYSPKYYFPATTAPFDHDFQLGGQIYG